LVFISIREFVYLVSLSHQKDDCIDDFSPTNASSSTLRVVTRCPGCATSFRVNQQQLSAMNGEVRCGICAKIFNAQDHLVQKVKTAKLATEQTAEKKSNEVVKHHQKINASDLQVSDFSPPSNFSKMSQAQFETQGIAIAAGQRISPNLDLNSELSPDQQAADSPADNEGEVTDACLAADLENEDPLQISSKIRKKIYLLLLSISTVTLLSITLVLLYGYLNRDSLAQHVEYRPWLVNLCNVAGCELSLFKDTARIEIINKDIRTHPSRSHTLLVRASFINNGVFTQEYPLLKVTLYDFNKIDVVTRRFEPRDYLPKGKNIADGFSPNSRVIVELEMLDENEAAVGYEISFQ